MKLAIKLGILPQIGREAEPLCIVHPGQPGGTHIYARFRLRLVNHGTSWPLRVIGCSLVLKKPHWGLWSKRLVEVPALNGITAEPIDLFVPPFSPPTEVDVQADALMNLGELPRWFHVAIVLDTVGPMRRIERRLPFEIRPQAPGATGRP